jgi:hypothetical protein
MQTIGSETADLQVAQDQSEDIEVVETEVMDEEPFVTYDLAVYPADYTLSVLDQMWKEGDIVVPSFQRKFVWTIRQSSKLIESLLMGLPVPQAFFLVEPDGRNLVIDGLQRIMSIVYFFSGFFGEETYQGKKTVFRLASLSSASPYAGKTFKELPEADQRKLRNSVLRVINVKQLGPKNDDTSAYHIFERLNTGGTPLTAQEIRHCVFHGPLVELLSALNKDAAWRAILGKEPLDKHQKDVELLLRVLSFATRAEQYEKPMKEFLNHTMSHFQNAGSSEVRAFAANFPVVCRAVVDQLGSKPFHPKGRLNASALDAVLGTLLSNGCAVPSRFRERFEALMADPEFVDTLSVSTSDVAVVRQRLAAVSKHLA